MADSLTVQERLSALLEGMEYAAVSCGGDMGFRAKWSDYHEWIAHVKALVWASIGTNIPAPDTRAADEKTWAEKHTIVVGKYNEACAANERLEAERAERSAVLEAIAVEMEHEGPQAVMRFEWAKRIREAM